MSTGPSGARLLEVPAELHAAVLAGAGRGHRPPDVTGMLGAVLLYRYGLRVRVGIQVIDPGTDTRTFAIDVDGGMRVAQLLDRASADSNSVADSGDPDSGDPDAGSAPCEVVVRAVSVDPPPAGCLLCVDLDDGRPVAVSMAGFSGRQADILARCLARLWLAVARMPGTAVDGLPFAAPVSDTAISRSLTAALGDPPVPPVLRVVEQAGSDPDRPAVSHEGRRLTYGELVARAARLGAALRDLGIGRGSLVGLTGTPSADLVVAIVAIHLIAAAYVPLDQANPENRLRAIAQDSGLALVVDCGEGWSPSGAGLRIVRPADMNLDDASGATVLDGHPPSAPGAGDLAYVLYTSGSTGDPKGVLVSHGNMARLFSETAPLLAIGPDDTWTLFHSYAFDFSVWEIWGALLHGGRLVVVPYDHARDPSRLLDLLVAEKITVLSQTPSAFASLAAAEEKNPVRSLPALRLVVLGGEAVDYGLLSRWAERHPLGGPRLVNMYGITETTVHVTLHEIRPPDLHSGNRTIGRPIPDLRVHLLDEAGAPVPDGAVGEMWIEGPGVALGYLGRPELSRARFAGTSAVPAGRRYRSGDLGRLNAEGLLEYHGRTDDQVKVRGYRIELGEVEAAVRAHPDLTAACVVTELSPSGHNRLVAYVVVAAEPGPSGRELFDFVRDRLPLYMVPQKWHTVGTLPLTVNGKIDRAALRKCVRGTT